MKAIVSPFGFTIVVAMLSTVVVATAHTGRPASQTPSGDPTCASSGPCVEYQNTTSGGQGIEGVDNSGIGVLGTTHGASGVKGTSTSGFGVCGAAGSGIGVKGTTMGSTGTSFGVLGYAGTAATDAGPYTAAVEGSSEASNAVAGYSNEGYGVYARSSASDGVVGDTFNASSGGSAAYGVWGSDVGTGPYNSGVYGTSTSGTGVQGTSAKGNGAIATTNNPSKTTELGFSGVYGDDSSTDGGGLNVGVTGFTTAGTGVVGISTSGSGTAGESTSGYGVVGTTTNPSKTNGDERSGVYGEDLSSDGGFRNDGVDGVSTDGTGVSGQSTGGDGVAGQSTNLYGIEAHSTNDAGVYTESDNFIGAWATGPTGLVADCTATDEIEGYGAGGPNYFVDCTGSTTSVVRSRNHLYATTSTPRSTLPVLEDYGEGQLVDGHATVQLDPAFAATITDRSPYLVFVTPDGDTKGLYVTNKTLQSFDVRETQGGTSSLTFDYRIVARPASDNRPRMTLAMHAPPAPRLESRRVVGVPQITAPPHPPVLLTHGRR